MGWKMLVKPFDTADMTGTPPISQRFKVSDISLSYLLNGVSLGVVFYGDPAFTALTAELWSDRGGSPIRLLESSSNSYLKADCLTTFTNGYKFLGFSFANPYPLKNGTYYHIALRASGYTGITTSYVALRHSYPDPQYRTGLTLTIPKGAKHPFEMGLMTEKA